MTLPKNEEGSDHLGWTSLKHQLAARPAVAVLFGLVVGLTLQQHPGHIFFLLAGLWFVDDRRFRVSLGLSFLVGAVLTPELAPRLESSSYRREVVEVVSVPSVGLNGVAFSAKSGSMGYRIFLPHGPIADRLIVGDQIQFGGLVRPLRPETEMYFRVQGVSGRVTPDRIALVGHGTWLARTAKDASLMFSGRMNAWLPTERANFMNALVLGSQDLLLEKTADSLRATGTFHVVAASGMQVTAFASIIALLVRRLPVPRGVRFGLIAAVLILYTLVAGASVAVVRAAIMFLVAYGAFFFRRERDFLSSWCIAGIVILLWQPSAVFQIGAQLSFIVMLFLGLFGGIGETDLPWKDLLRSSWIGFWASSPLTAYYFGFVPALALLANLLIATAITVLFFAGLGLSAVGSVFPGVASWAAPWLLGNPLRWIDWVTTSLGSDSRLQFRVPAFSAYLLLVYYGAILWFWRPLKREA